MKKDYRFVGVRGVSLLLFVLLHLGLLAGCAKKPPDFDQIKADLNTILQENRENTSTGNADIYRIVSLSIINSRLENEADYVVEYEGEVECTRGFYMFADGTYSVAKPSGKAKRHATRGTLIGFTGRIDYESGATGWRIRDNSTTMKIKYAPRL